jgi:type 1 glutamine amidotransferase/sugar phosphate isomerase/epimerase
MKRSLILFSINFLIYSILFLNQPVNAQIIIKSDKTPYKNDLSDTVLGKTKDKVVMSKAVAGLLVGREKERDLIEQALPSRASVQAQRPRRLLIFDLNVNYGGHGSIDYANYAFARMGQKTGAYEAMISSDTEVFRPEILKGFDAVFFNNNVGNLFTDKTLRQSLLDFVYAGGGLLGLHGSSAAFTYWPGAKEDWPEFGVMIGARGASHRENNEHVFFRLEDPDHPVIRVFGGKEFDYREEFFRFMNPYSRDKVRVLLSFDTVKTDLEQGRGYGQVIRPDKDYAIAWVRQYGRGRVFHCSIGHHPYTFWDKTMLGLFLDAIQFALGDLQAPTLASGRLTPALDAQETLGWKLGIEANTFKNNTLFETIDKTKSLGIQYVGGLNVQNVSTDIPRNFDFHLSDEEVLKVREKLISEGISMPTYYIIDIPGDEETILKIFEFGRKMGIETFISEPKLGDLDLIEKYCEKYNIKLAIHNHGKQMSPAYMYPEKIVQITSGRSPLIGAACDFGYWEKEGIDPLKAIKTLGHRVITLQIHDLNKKNSSGHDVPWGTGKTDLDGIFEYLKKENIKPVMFGLEYSYNWNNSLPEIIESINYFNKKSVGLTNLTD